VRAAAGGSVPAWLLVASMWIWFVCAVAWLARLAVLGWGFPLSAWVVFAVG
jgi:hypothetical protein